MKFLSVSIRYCSSSPQAIHISPVFNGYDFFVQKTEILLSLLLGQIYPDIHLYSCQTTLLTCFRNYRLMMNLAFSRRARTRNGKVQNFSLSLARLKIPSAGVQLCRTQKRKEKQEKSTRSSSSLFWNTKMTGQGCCVAPHSHSEKLLLMDLRDMFPTCDKTQNSPYSCLQNGTKELQRISSPRLRHIQRFSFSKEIDVLFNPC